MRCRVYAVELVGSKEKSSGDESSKGFMPVDGWYSRKTRFSHYAMARATVGRVGPAPGKPAPGLVECELDPIHPVRQRAHQRRCFRPHAIRSVTPRYDLHAHSHVSDGTLPPRGLIERAARAGVDVLALTDHDTTEGLADARQAAVEHGVSLVAGVEISVTWEGHTVHVVGLHIDADDPDLNAGMQGLRRRRNARAAEIAARLADRDIRGALEGVERLVQGPIVSRTHFAHYLVAQGHAKDLRQAFKRYLGAGRPAYARGQWAGLAEAVGWIRGAGGEAVIAHPARYKLGTGRLQQLFGEFRDLGGSALEVVSGSHTPADVARMGRFAVRFGLKASAGSDYHGPDKPWVELGALAPLPAGCVPIWRDW
jgi:predicted metal-dependent phosphoesterase TrpH